LGLPEGDDSVDDLEAHVAKCLCDLRAGYDSARVRILEICDQRFRALAHRLLGRFAKVRRWDNTDDVAQYAALRLYRALSQPVPETPRGLMGLMASQIQWELLDLARKHAGPMSYAANHGTNVHNGPEERRHYIDEAPDARDADEEIPLERWEAFHAAVEALPAELREVFRLVWYLDVDRKTAADTLGVSPRTVDRRWQEARAAVQQALNGDG